MSGVTYYKNRNGSNLTGLAGVVGFYVSEDRVVSQNGHRSTVGYHASTRNGRFSSETGNVSILVLR